MNVRRSPSTASISYTQLQGVVSLVIKMNMYMYTLFLGIWCVRVVLLMHR